MMSNRLLILTISLFAIFYGGTAQEVLIGSWEGKIGENTCILNVTKSSMKDNFQEVGDVFGEIKIGNQTSSFHGKVVQSYLDYSCEKLFEVSITLVNKDNGNNFQGILYLTMVIALKEDGETDFQGPEECVNIAANGTAQGICLDLSENYVLDFDAENLKIEKQVELKLSVK